MLGCTLVPLALALVGLVCRAAAFPAGKHGMLVSGVWYPTPVACGVANLTIPLPANQTELAVPLFQTLTEATIGRGVQNYTCKAGVWVSTGALANLYDLNCLPAGLGLPGDADATALPAIALHKVPFPLESPAPAIKHDFITTPGNTSTISPSFFIPRAPPSIGLVTLGRKGSLPSPDNSTVDVPWLQLAALPGHNGLADTVFRLATAGGQPTLLPVCHATLEGQEKSVQYAALYYFLKK